MPAFAETIDLERSTMRKIRRRVLPFVSLLYFTAFLDRANVAYGRLTMAPDLGFSEWVFGLGAGLFFLGYVLLEIPGALIVQKYGARRWTARILVTWGICTICLGFIHSAHQFYIGRFVLGAAEAGFFPGMIVYLTCWVPSRFRAGAIATMVIASPVALALGGPIASVLLQIHWLGLAGWRWLSILEGVPAIVLGVVAWYFLTDRPEGATWLTPEERHWLQEDLRAECEAKGGTRATLWKALRSPVVIALCVIIFLANIGIQGFFLWLPVTVQRASGMSVPMTALVSGLPFVVAVASALVFSWTSDRTNKRVPHIWIPLVVASLIFSLTAIDGLGFAGLLSLLCASGAAIYAFGPSFYILPTLLFSESAAAAAVIGLINIFAGLGGFAGPTIVGWLLNAGYPFSFAVVALSVCFFLAGALTFSIRRHWKYVPA